MTIRLGVVGLSKNGGWASSNLIPPILAKPLSDDYTLTAVSTSSSASASATALHYSELTKHEVKGYHGSTEAISEDPNVDIVAVSINVFKHLDAALLAIKAGKDVFVEWPLGRNLEEAKILARAAREKGVRTIVGLQGWNVPAFVKAKEWIDTNKIGRVISSSWFSVTVPEIGLGGSYLVSRYEYARDPEYGAGYLDIPIGHGLAAVIRTLGKFLNVSTTATIGFKEGKIADSIDSKDGRFVTNEAPDQWAITGITESGALFSGTWLQLGKTLPAGQPSFIWEIVGTEGKIRIESSSPFTGSFPAIAPPETIFLNGERVDLTQENASQSPTARAWKTFANKETSNVPSFEDAVELHRVINAIRKSHSEERAISISEI